MHTPAASAAGDEAILAAPRPDAASRPPSRTTTCAVSARRKHAHARQTAHRSRRQQARPSILACRLASVHSRQQTTGRRGKQAPRPAESPQHGVKRAASCLLGRDGAQHRRSGRATCSERRQGTVQARPTAAHPPLRPLASWSRHPAAPPAPAPRRCCCRRRRRRRCPKAGRGGKSRGAWQSGRARYHCGPSGARGARAPR